MYLLIKRGLTKWREFCHCRWWNRFPLAGNTWKMTMDFRYADIEWYRFLPISFSCPQAMKYITCSFYWGNTDDRSYFEREDWVESRVFFHIWAWNPTILCPLTFRAFFNSSVCNVWYSREFIFRIIINNLEESWKVLQGSSWVESGNCVPKK